MSFFRLLPIPPTTQIMPLKRQTAGHNLGSGRALTSSQSLFTGSYFSTEERILKNKKIFIFYQISHLNIEKKVVYLNTMHSE